MSFCKKFKEWFSKWILCIRDPSSRSFRSIFRSFIDTSGSTMLYMTSSVRREVMTNHSPNLERSQCPLSNLDEDYEHEEKEIQ